MRLRPSTAAGRSIRRPAGAPVSAPSNRLSVVTNYAVRWLGDRCRVGRMYKTGATVHIQAFCWGAQGERSIPVSMTPHNGRLSVTWDRGAHGELDRCP